MVVVVAAVVVGDLLWIFPLEEHLVLQEGVVGHLEDVVVTEVGAVAFLEGVVVVTEAEEVALITGNQDLMCNLDITITIFTGQIKEENVVTDHISKT